VEEEHGGDGDAIGLAGLCFGPWPGEGRKHACVEVFHILQYFTILYDFNRFDIAN
jgi:hypothetical protein